MQREMTIRVFEFGTSNAAPRIAVRDEARHDLYPRGILASLRAAWHASRSADELNGLAVSRETGRATGARF